MGVNPESVTECSMTGRHGREVPAAGRAILRLGGKRVNIVFTKQTNLVANWWLQVHHSC